MTGTQPTPRDPVEATGTITERAIQGAYVSLVISFLQLFFIELYAAMQSASTSQVYAGEMELIFQTGMLGLILLPVVSTIVSVAITYSIADWIGVGLYLVISTAASVALGASLTAALIFISGMFAFLFVVVVKMNSSQDRRPHRRLR